MKQATRARYQQEILGALCMAYGITDPTVQFEATVPVTIRLNRAIQDSSEFLKLINILPVTDMSGDVLRMSTPNPIASRTNTKDKKARREPVLAGGPGENKYECKKTNYDHGIEYSTLDLWARFRNFAQLYQDSIYKRIALDRMLIGFMGIMAAENSDREKYPELQDVNKGWLKLIEERKPENFIKEGTIKPGKIIIGKNGDFKNLDQLVYAMWKAIPKAHRSENHIAIVGDRLVTHDTDASLGSFAQQPTEKAAMAVLERRYGTRIPHVVPMFPETGLMICNPKNLHIYYQDSATRRRTKDEPEYDRVANYMSSNDAYAIEDYDSIIALDHNAIEITDNPAADRTQIQGADLKNKEKADTKANAEAEAKKGAAEEAKE